MPEQHQDAVRAAADAALRELHLEDVDARAVAVYALVNHRGRLSVVSVEPTVDRLTELGPAARGALVFAYQEALERLGAGAV